MRLTLPHLLKRLLPLGCMVLILTLVTADNDRPETAVQPWEIWRDLNRLAWVEEGDQVLLRSSHCPSGCRYDRHSKDDWRYLRVDGDEGVIFEEAGAGAITRIWMTMGQGESQPLARSVRLRIYLDQAEAPVVDLPLPDLFNGSTPPFVPPLVGDRLVSSGGNFSYVPIPYRDGCRVTLVGAHEHRIWYQLTYHRLAQSGTVVSFTGTEDLSDWAALLGTQGTDPWPPSASATTSRGTVQLRPGKKVRVARLAGPDSLTALRLLLSEQAWHDTELSIVSDRVTRVQMPLADFFAAGRTGGAPSRSLLVGADAAGWLYSYFPMPFSRRAEIYLERDPGTDTPLDVSWQLRTAGTPPHPASGRFGARLQVHRPNPVGVDIELLQLSGRGKWVGLFAELGSVATESRQYLEGDERVFLGGSTPPALHGTGVEDFFNGGFYFDQGPFCLALHGSPYHLTPGGEDVTAAYRLLLSDAVAFSNGITVGLEGGPTGDLSLRARSVAYYYLR